MTTEKYHTWSNYMEVVLRGKRLWKIMKHINKDSGNKDNGVDVQKKDLDLVYLLTSIDASCKLMMRRFRCPAEVWELLRRTFSMVSEASIDAKLTQLQALSLKKGEKIVEYAN